MLDDLTAGDVIIKGAYSSVNYKDALAGSGQGRILRQYPLVGGIDVAGIVVDTKTDKFNVGDNVLITGAGHSESYDSGYAEYVRAPHHCIIPLPENLTMEQAMVMGTPALTAALALHRMEQNGQTSQLGPIVITGASGGVGQLAIDLFSAQDYEVIAVSRKSYLRSHLTALGADPGHHARTVNHPTTPIRKGSLGWCCRHRWRGAAGRAMQNNT